MKQLIMDTILEDIRNEGPIYKELDLHKAFDWKKKYQMFRELAESFRESESTNVCDNLESVDSV